MSQYVRGVYRSVACSRDSQLVQHGHGHLETYVVGLVGNGSLRRRRALDAVDAFNSEERHIRFQVVKIHAAHKTHVPGHVDAVVLVARSSGRGRPWYPACPRSLSASRGERGSAACCVSRTWERAQSKARRMRGVG